MRQVRNDGWFLVVVGQVWKEDRFRRKNDGAGSLLLVRVLLSAASSVEIGSDWGLE